MWRFMFGPEVLDTRRTMNALQMRRSIASMKYSNNQSEENQTKIKHDDFSMIGGKWMWVRNSNGSGVPDFNTNAYQAIPVWNLESCHVMTYFKNLPSKDLKCRRRGKFRLSQVEPSLEKIQPMHVAGLFSRRRNISSKRLTLWTASVTFEAMYWKRG